MSEETSPRASRSRWKTAITVAFYLLVGVLLTVYLLGLDYSSLARIRLGWAYLALALAVGMVQRLLVPLTWVLIVRSLGVEVRNYPAYNFVYAKAWLGRYLPGKVAMVAARVYFADKLGASRSVIAVSSVAEIGAQLLVGCVVGLVGVASIGASVDVIAPFLPFAYGLIALMAVMLFPPVFNTVFGLLLRMFGRSLEGRPRVGARTLAWAVSGFAVVSIATGALAVLLAAAVDPSAFDQPLFVWGTYSLAGALGMAFVFAPSGIGAREAVHLPLLTLVFSNEAALAIVLLSRLMETALDGLFYGVSALWARLRRSPT